MYMDPASGAGRARADVDAYEISADVVASMPSRGATWPAQRAPQTRSKLVGSTIMSRIVTVRLRVRTYLTASATSLG